jgi:hypothetical protein
MLATFFCKDQKKVAQRKISAWEKSRKIQENPEKFRADVFRLRFESIGFYLNFSFRLLRIFLSRLSPRREEGIGDAWLLEGFRLMKFPKNLRQKQAISLRKKIGILINQNPTDAQLWCVIGRARKEKS